MWRSRRKRPPLSRRRLRQSSRLKSKYEEAPPLPALASHERPKTAPSHAMETRAQAGDQRLSAGDTSRPFAQPATSSCSI
jgi:hypothetical protein